MKSQTPPHSLDFERSILSSCLHHKNDLVEFIALLKPADFYSERHQVIFELIRQMHTESEPANLITIFEKISAAGLQDKAGGASYLATLFDEPVSTNCKFYAETIKSHALRRRLIEAGNTIMKNGFKKDTPPGELLDKSQQLVLSIHESSNGHKISSISELVTIASDRYQSLYENPGETTGIPSGFHQLDIFTCGFQPSDLVIIAKPSTHTGPRLYDSWKWKKARARYLKQNPLCLDCVQRGRTKAAEVVHHDPPCKSNDGQFWDANTWVPLCRACHNHVHANDRHPDRGTPK
jgi:replicative DNA helicase